MASKWSAAEAKQVKNPATLRLIKPQSNGLSYEKLVANS
jgi:hypothetical protein